MRRSAFIVCHSNGMPGGLYNLENYLQSRDYDYYELLHPLDDYSVIQTTLKHPNGHVESIKRANVGLRSYMQDFMLSVKYIRQYHTDIFIGGSNFDTLPAIFCQKILRTKIPTIIYYPRDFSEERFNNRILDYIYNRIEKIVVKYSDQIVSNTTRAEEKRISLGLQKQRSVVIPNPITLGTVSFNPKRIKKQNFIFEGDVTKEHGLYDLIKVLTPYIKKLVIIGRGDDWNRTIAYAKKQKFVLETHHNKSHEFVLNYLQNFNGIGLAPYNLHSKWTYYCSPLKVVEYISCGVPVLMSDVPEMAKKVNELGVGITYHTLSYKTLKTKIIDFNTESYEKRAKNFYKLYKTTHLLKALNI